MVGVDAFSECSPNNNAHNISLENIIDNITMQSSGDNDDNSYDILDIERNNGGDNGGDSGGNGDSEGDSRGDNGGDSEGDSRGDSGGDSEGDSEEDDESNSFGHQWTIQYMKILLCLCCTMVCIGIAIFISYEAYDYGIYEATIVNITNDEYVADS